MASLCQMDINFTLLPMELQFKIYEQLTLEELFALNRQQIPMLESLDIYINDYLDKEKYKEHTKLKDCIFLMNFEEYKYLIVDYFYDLVTNIGVRFFDDVTKAGGPIGFINLAKEENPRNIYTIKIEMVKDSYEFEYYITSVGGTVQNRHIYYNFGFNNSPKNTKTIGMDVNEIVNTLIHIVDLMNLDNRRIKSIRYYREKYMNNFINLKLSTIYIDEGFNLFY